MDAVNIGPARVLAPGRTLKNEIVSLGITQKEFAQLIERPPQFVSELANGRRELTADTANRLAAALGSSPEFWLRLEANYRAWKASQSDDSVQVYDRIRERSEKYVAESKKKHG